MVVRRKERNELTFSAVTLICSTASSRFRTWISFRKLPTWATVTVAPPSSCFNATILSRSAPTFCACGDFLLNPQESTTCQAQAIVSSPIQILSKKEKNLRGAKTQKTWNVRCCAADSFTELYLSLFQRGLLELDLLEKTSQLSSWCNWTVDDLYMGCGWSVSARVVGQSYVSNFLQDLSETDFVFFANQENLEQCLHAPRGPALFSRSWNKPRSLGNGENSS